MSRPAGRATSARSARTIRCAILPPGSGPTARCERRPNNVRVKIEPGCRIAAEAECAHNPLQRCGVATRTPSFVLSRVLAESPRTRRPACPARLASVSRLAGRSVAWMRRAGLHPTGEYVASLVIDFAMGSSTGAPMLLTATVSIAGDDAALRWPA